MRVLIVKIRFTMFALFTTLLIFELGNGLSGDSDSGSTATAQALLWMTAALFHTLATLYFFENLTHLWNAVRPGGFNPTSVTTLKKLLDAFPVVRVVGIAFCIALGVTFVFKPTNNTVILLQVGLALVYGGMNAPVSVLGIRIGLELRKHRLSYKTVSIHLPVSAKMVESVY